MPRTFIPAARTFLNDSNAFTGATAYSSRAVGNLARPFFPDGQFNNPNGSCCGSSSFGTITSTLGSGQGSVNGVGGGRTLQGSAKLMF